MAKPIERAAVAHGDTVPTWWSSIAATAHLTTDAAQDQLSYSEGRRAPAARAPKQVGAGSVTTTLRAVGCNRTHQVHAAAVRAGAITPGMSLRSSCNYKLAPLFVRVKTVARAAVFGHSSQPCPLPVSGPGGTKAPTTLRTYDGGTQTKRYTRTKGLSKSAALPTLSTVGIHSDDRLFPLGRHLSLDHQRKRR